MKMNLKKIGLVAAVATAPLFVVNANAATATGDTSAQIIAALTLAQNAKLDFGSIVADATGGTVTMSQGGVRDCGTLVCSAQKKGAAAAFAVTGEPSYTYAITLPGTSFNIANGTNSMAVTVSGPATGTLDGTGNGTFNVGGSLTVGANQVKGAYTGTYSVSVDYN